MSSVKSVFSAVAGRLTNILSRLRARIKWARLTKDPATTGEQINLLSVPDEPEEKPEPKTIDELPPETKRKMMWAREKMMNKLKVDKKRPVRRLVSQAKRCVVCGGPIDRNEGQNVLYCSKGCRFKRHNKRA